MIVERIPCCDCIWDFLSNVCSRPTNYWLISLIHPAWKWGMMEMGHWLVWMEWCPAGLSVCLPLLSPLAPWTTKPHHNRFTALFPGPPGWAGARRELLDFMVQGKINRGIHTDHLAGLHSIRTNQCPPPPSPVFYRPYALPATQPTVSKHWRQLAHSD